MPAQPIPYRLVLCLPKTGSTSFAQRLQAHGQVALHEWETLPVLNLGGLRPREDFEQCRRAWIQVRSQRLKQRVDVNTALYALLLELMPAERQQLGLQPQLLCRSLGPWLRSMIPWCLRFGSDPYRDPWLSLHRGFVQALASDWLETMPANPSDEASLLAFWVPVWLGFLRKVLRDGEPYHLTHQLPAAHHANRSGFEPGWFERFDQLVPPLPELSGDRSRDAEVVARCEAWWLQHHLSRGWASPSNRAPG